MTHEMRTGFRLALATWLVTLGSCAAPIAPPIVDEPTPVVTVDDVDPTEQPAEADSTGPIPRIISGAPFPVTKSQLLAHVRFLSDDQFRGRYAGTPEDRLTATYLLSHFETMGLEPAGDDGGWLQSFEFTDAGEAVRTHNVIARLPGARLPDEYFIIGAHIDHLGVSEAGEVFNGADDNASGVAALIELARAFTEGPLQPRRSILFIGFGAEERGLRGSRHYIENPAQPLENLVAMINLDMISHPSFLAASSYGMMKAMLGVSTGPGVGLLGGDGAPGLFALARASCELEELANYAPSDFPMFKKAIEEKTTGRDDSAVFRDRGLPTLFFSTSENDHYHQTTDTYEKISGPVLHTITRVVWRTVLAADALSEKARIVEGL